ncbi:MAG: hypothetical protein V7K38_11315 [Nostoc sp.]|uniref:hypothetical protein n=1 Tax=Nostoc sp. TaxID=1180 RepID=UPI002FFB8E3A
MTTQAELKILDQTLEIKIVLSLEELDLIKKEIDKKAIEDVSLFSWAWGHKSFKVIYDNLVTK